MKAKGARNEVGNTLQPPPLPPLERSLLLEAKNSEWEIFGRGNYSSLLVLFQRRNIGPSKEGAMGRWAGGHTTVMVYVDRWNGLGAIGTAGAPQRHDGHGAVRSPGGGRQTGGEEGAAEQAFT